MPQLDLSKLPKPPGSVSPSKRRGLDLSKLPKPPGGVLVDRIPEETPFQKERLKTGSSVKGNARRITPADSWTDTLGDTLGIMDAAGNQFADTVIDTVRSPLGLGSVAEQRKREEEREAKEGPMLGPGYMEIPGVQEGFKRVADYIDPPTGEGSWGQGFVAGGLQGLGNIVAHGADYRNVFTKPRTYQWPYDLKVTPIPNRPRTIPPSRQLEAGPPRSDLPDLPAGPWPGGVPKPFQEGLPATTPRRFLGNAETLNPLAARESRFAPTGVNAAMAGEPAKFDVLGPNINPEWDPQVLAELKTRVDRTNLDLTRFRNADEVQEAIDQFDRNAGTPTLARYVQTAEGEIVDTTTGEVMPSRPDSEFGERPELKIETRGTVDPAYEVQGARNPDGSIVISSNIERQANELITGYNAPLPIIIGRESFTNFIDAVKELGESGELSIRYINPPGGGSLGGKIEFKDNGKGVNEEELATVFVDFHSSGKEGDALASGGKGVGKAPYLLGAQHFKVETVALENGKKMKHTMEGTPEQFRTAGQVFPTSIQVPDETPTGTTYQITLKPDQNIYSVKGIVDEMITYSRGMKSKIKMDRMYSTDFESPGQYEEIKWRDSMNPDKPIATKSFPHSDVTLSQPDDANLAMRRRIDIRVLNKGVYQYMTSIYASKDEHLPSELILDISPKVEEGTGSYPFGITRESLKEDIQTEITNFIAESVINPSARDRQSRAQEIYDNFVPIPTPLPTKRKAVLFDPENKLTAAEKEKFLNSPIIQNFAMILDNYYETVLTALGNKFAYDRLEGIGISVDPDYLGLHVPNPSTFGTEAPKSTIVINLFPELERSAPSRAAIEIVSTLAHEGAHIGLGTPLSIPRLDISDISDPRAAIFLETYMREIQTYGGSTTGHGFDFVKRLGEIYVKTGVKKSLQVADAIEQTIATRLPDGSLVYADELQDLLRIHNERFGRAAVTEDVLSRMGEKQAAPAGGRRGAQGGNNNNRGGTPPPRTPIVDRVGQHWPGGRQPDPRDLMLEQRVQQTGLINRFLGFAKGMKTTGDFPPMFRQGMGYSGRKNWLRMWKHGFSSYASEGGHERFIADMRNHPLMVEGPDGRTKADKMGLRVTFSDLGPKEERMMGIDEAEHFFQHPIVRYPITVASAGLVRNPARASNRGYHDTVVGLRLGGAAEVLHQYEKFHLSLTRFAAELERRGMRQAAGKMYEYADTMHPENPAILEGIGEDVNMVTGWMKLGWKERRLPKWLPERIPGTGIELADRIILNEWDAEGMADTTNLAVFSGRLFKSRVAMYNKLLNPYSYLKADPVMAVEYLKQLLSLLGMRTILLSLYGMGGAWIYQKMTGPRHGEAGLGRGGKQFSVDTTGGMGKIETLGARLATGEVTNAKDRTYKLGQTAFTPTAEDILTSFGKGLAAPVPSLVRTVLAGKDPFTGKPNNYTSMNPFENTISKQLFTPMSWQTAYDIMQTDPDYIPLFFPDAVGQAVTVYER